MDITLVVGVMVFTYIAQNPKYRQVDAQHGPRYRRSRGPNESVILGGAWTYSGVSLASAREPFHPADPASLVPWASSWPTASSSSGPVRHGGLERGETGIRLRGRGSIASGFMAQRQSLPLAQLENRNVRQGKACLQNMEKPASTARPLPDTSSPTHIRTSGNS